MMEIENNKEVPEMGNRMVPFSRELYVDGEDFMEVPVKKYFRLFPGNEVRFKGAYFITCNEVVKNEDGSIKEIRCTADLETRNEKPVDGRKVKGTIHWVSVDYAKDIDVVLYDKLFTIPNLNDMGENETYDDYLNRDSVKVLKGCKAEPSLTNDDDIRYQFVRTGYFIKDRKKDNTFIRIVELKDSFSK